MNPEVYRLLIEFLLAVVSGGVAGLIAGWVLMRLQLRAQLAIDDTPKLIGIIQSLQDARNEIYFALMMLDHLRQHEKDFDEEEEQAKIEAAVSTGNYLIMKIASQAELFRSERYKRLRLYLIFFITRGDAWFHDDPTEAMKMLDGLVADIKAYVYSPSVIARAKQLLKRLKGWRHRYRNRLSQEEKELMVEATRKAAFLTVVDTAKTPFVYILTGRMYSGNEEAPKYMKAFNRLLKDGYLQDAGASSYTLSRKGWKTVVPLVQGQLETELMI